MSGTSLDGLDLAFCFFQYQQNGWTFSLENTASVEYSSSRREQLKNSINLSSVDLLLLNVEYGKWLGNQVKEFIEKRNIKVDFVSSHGHTVFHQPEKRLTYQIGCGQELANICGLQVFADFRSLDVSLGGQGAPLVPIGDQLLFPQYDFCLNLGGIANASFQVDGQRVAYDISPANMLLNHLSAQMGQTYDKSGEVARSAKLNKKLLSQLNALAYYRQPYPKSLGYEWFIEQIVPLVEASTISKPDKLCTSVHHIAAQISKDLLRHSPGTNSKLLATGGGAKNTFLIETLQEYLGESIQVIIPDISIVDFKEAMVFAFMGVRRKRNEINCLKSVTGASRDSSSGVIYLPYE